MHPLPEATGPAGVLRVNPLYAPVGADAPGSNARGAAAPGAPLRLRLRFPSEDYEDEYGACRRYLPEEVTLDPAILAAVAEGRRSAEVEELVRRRVVLDVPPRYC